MKRLFDIVLSFFGLLVLCVPLLFLAWQVRRKLGSPVLFTQVRPGMHGKPFRMMKFRSMTSECGPDGQLLPDAVRLTPFGRWLRATSLDELPGLWSVLRGDMSFGWPPPVADGVFASVQPRAGPQARGASGNYRLGTGKRAQRHQLGRQVQAGCVVCRQPKFVVGYQNTVADCEKVLVRDGISAEGEATMTRFTGSKRV